MKRKIIKKIIIIICLFFIIYALRSLYLYTSYSNNKSFFGDEYIQVIYLTTILDYINAKKILKEADDALSTITNEEDAHKRFGKLGDLLCVTDENAVSEKHKLKFIAANFSKDSGYIWVVYSSSAYDKNGEVTTGSWGILSRWELEKENDKWVVTTVSEAP